MKIAVVGASGRSGKLFVEQALADGHYLNAGVHHTNNLKPNENLNILKIDATNTDDMAKLLKNQEVVVSLIGHVRHSDPNVQTKTMESLVKAMKKHGLKRIISLTGTGVRQPKDKISLIDRLLNLIILIIDPKRVKDGREHLKILQQSNLDWTVIRVLKLQNNKPKKFRLTLYGPTKLFVSRAEVGEAILRVISENSFIKRAPIISKLKD